MRRRRRNISEKSKYQGVSKDASPFEMNNAYRKLVMTHPPDQDCVKAQNNDEKRQIYDESVEEGFKDGGDPSDVPQFPSAILERANYHVCEPKKCENVIPSLLVTLADL